MNNQWIKPRDVAKARLMNCDAVYNFILSGGHSVEVNGINCVTFGHNFKGQKVEHKYFGSKMIIEDLKKIEGFENGSVSIEMDSFVRDGVSGSTCGIKL